MIRRVVAPLARLSARDRLTLIAVAGSLLLAARAAWVLFTPPAAARAGPVAAAQEAGPSKCDELWVEYPHEWAADAALLHETAVKGCRQAEERLGLRLKEPITVRFEADRESLNRDCPANSGGCWDAASKTIFIADPTDREAVAHEIGHALLETACGVSPLAWINEAIAQEAAGGEPFGRWRDLAGLLAVTPVEEWDALFYNPILGMPGKRLTDLPTIAPSYQAAHLLLTRLLLPHTIPEFTRALCDEKPEHVIANAFKRVTGRDFEAALKEAAGL